MNYKTISLDEINIIGIETRTDNNNAAIDIPKLWQSFFSANIQSKITNKLTEEILGLYTDYESDYTKSYTLVIGCKVKDFVDIPEGMVSKKIPASKYAVFNPKGKMPDEIVNTWKYVWSSGLERTYTGDFELSGEKYSSSDPELEIYVAVK